MLRRHGFRVVTATNYDEAKRQIDGVRFAAVVADYRLGPGYDGFDLLRYVAEVAPLVVRVLVTADEIGAVLSESVGGHWVSKTEDAAARLPEVIREALRRLSSGT